MDEKILKKIIEMVKEDERVLQELFDSGELPSEDYHPRMRAVHENNAIKLKEIINKHGWPGKKLVGSKGSKAAWLIAQHSVCDMEFMSECSGYVKDAVDNEDAEGWQLAFLQDRVHTMAGEKQYYGTQFDDDEDGWPVPFPIVDRDNVNQRRIALGLNTLEERWEEMRQRERLFRERKNQVNATE